MRQKASSFACGDLDASSKVFAGDADAAAGARCLMMLSDGLLDKQIAYELSVSEAMVKAHVSAILQKLGVESRTQAVIAAARIEAGSWKSGSEDKSPAKG